VSSNTPKNPVDEVDSTCAVAPMSLHEHMAIPPGNVTLSFSGVEVEFILSTLAKVHASLVETLADKKSTEDQRVSAHSFALNTENLYANIFKQLKLSRGERLDLN
jgi:hypothetical protein